MTTANTARFNAEAAAWDSNPGVLLASALASDAILSRLGRPDPLPDVLELGCGTGLLSLSLAPHVRSLTAVDAAEGMVAALRAKLAADGGLGGHSNVRAVCALLEDPDDARIREDPVAPEGQGEELPLPPRRFDLVVSHLMLHHVPDLAPLLRTMIGCLRVGGRVALTDYEDFGPAARRFHPEAKMDGVERHGVRGADMEALLRGAGFVDVVVETAFEMDKAVETEPGSGVLGPTMTFPFLICLGRRP
ncbi:S-adenosyl-L-methionine-dependent methyltransferase [Phialemonium atrogriseum]|uniref:S-adenosyl-L-methionine-dependent methyltransferase n=1 Tax=Phialemonium atrogriseum TaxID=1093897 RepID=A0AAJ0FDY5_9PEZI|nr:S-adenosyl-L-methionine-dependent methyltransferase [Phialemonium atrogriseum]KAK1765056.1 S-adenosyl-L-methionine-dependent methyltransferase [Phialemonium atrogriseum]